MREYKEYVQEAQLAFERMYTEDFEIDDKDREKVTELLKYVRDNSYHSYHMWILAESIFRYLDEYGKEIVDKIQSNPDIVTDLVRDLSKREEVKSEQSTE